MKRSKRFYLHLFTLGGILCSILAYSIIYTHAAKNTNSATYVETNKPMVTTESGKLLGYVSKGTYTFLGVPYAQAERFMMPEKVKPWDGIRRAYVYGEVCPVAPANKVNLTEFLTPTGSNQVQNENCQFLNVWSQNINKEAKKPVMIWLHGGGFMSGSASELSYYNGTNLSKNGDVVVVSLNHRLNALGYLDLSQYGEKYKYSGNVGTADIVAALKWVNANIDQFGGDPNNVTIFGQSGGGGKVLTLMGTPSAKGLFQKAICQSGFTNAVNKEKAQKVAAATLKNLGISASEIDKIKNIPYNDLITAGNKALSEVNGQQTSIEGAAWGPVADGEFYPTNVISDKFADQSKDIPLMIGTTMGEFNSNFIFESGLMTTFTANATTPTDNSELGYSSLSDSQALEKIKQKFGDQADAIVKAFKKAYPDKKLGAAMYMDTSFRQNSHSVTVAKAKQNGANVYEYIFAYEFPILGSSTPWHCGEIPFIFQNLDMVSYQLGGKYTEAQKLADKMSKAWVNFAYNGNPNFDNGVKWLPYSEENEATMIFDKKSYMTNNYDNELIKALAPSAVNASNTSNSENKKSGLTKEEDGFTYYYDKNGDKVKSDYVKLDDNTIYYFCENGRGFKQEYKKINKNLIEFFDNGITAAFLAIGEKKAALIDTQPGLGNLKKLASFFTDKPVQLILSHGHGDHVGGSFTFDQAYLNPADNSLFESHSKDIQQRFEYAKSMSFIQGQIFNIDYNSIMSINDFQNYKPIKLLPISDGQEFDLGNVTIKAITTPGHTAGMTSFILKEMKLLITGDAANNNTMIFDSTIEDYRKTLIKLKSFEKNWDTIYISHGVLESKAPITLIDDLIAICDGIMDGTIKGVSVVANGAPEDTIGNQVAAYERDDMMNRVDGKFANIVYSKERIFNK